MASLLDKVSDALRTGTVGAEVKRSAKWFQMKIKGLEGSLRNQWTQTNAPKFYREAETKVNPRVLKMRANLGDLYAYYYNPKHKTTLPYYDTFPLIMLIGYEKETFLGLNFHYLNPKLRAILLDRVTSKIGGGIIKWNKIAQIRQIEPTVKRYRYDHIVRKVIPIEEEEKEIAIFLPLERFKKASKSKVWGDSKKRMG
jgi:hypothetical protein